MVVIKNQNADMEHPLGYLFATLIGMSLGLIGGGGSILTVPVLVYIMGIAPVLSTSYSLFIVGTTALVGAFQFFKTSQLDFKTGLLFGLPSIIAVYATRKFIMPRIPDHLFSVGHIVFDKPLFIMTLFAVLMIMVSISMILPSREKNNTSKRLDGWVFYTSIMIEGGLVGILTGMVGAGGGFLIIPALVILAKLPMKMAIGTSLMIIALKSLIGFTGDLSHYTIQWSILILFTSFAILGMFIGTALGKKISGEKLKPAFGWFVLAMGFFILCNEFYLKK
jgi:uncharacterized membrane protein YfcA